MKKVLLLCTLFTLSVFAQLSIPNVEPIYGGRILGITATPLSSKTGYIFITTESANSGLYATYHTAPLSISSFSVLSSMGADDNLGEAISQIDVHTSSSKLFFIYNNGLYSTGIGSPSKTSVVSGPVNSFKIKVSTLVYIEADKLHFGTLSSPGVFTESASSPLIVSGLTGRTSFDIDPITSKLYIFVENGATPTIIRSSDNYDALTATTTFTTFNLTSLSASGATNWTGMGIAPTGRLYLGGHNNLEKFIAYSDNDTLYTFFNTGISGVSGPNFAFDSAGTSVYHASIYSNSSGVMGSWHRFGDVSYETHPNDGPVFRLPSGDSSVVLTTDQGLGSSFNKGSVIIEEDHGIEAVQVMDMDMQFSKNTAWIASKSGIRKVTNYSTGAVWSHAMWPGGDGSPYYSAEMDRLHPDTCYVGNVRVKKTTDGGATWNQVFTAENAPYNFTQGSFIDAIELCHWDKNVVMAGYNHVWTGVGGLFVSTNAGSSWSQILLSASSVGPDVNVTDIAFNKEGTDTVVYVSAAYPHGYSVYRLVKSGATWSGGQDMVAGHTSTGSLIVADIKDLYISPSGDTVFAAGTDAGTNHPVVYYKPVKTSNLWTPCTTSGFPFIAGKKATAVTWGVDTLYAAVDNEVYFLAKGATSWTLGYTYPVGTWINVLFYDDLLVGTGTGLYGHVGAAPTSACDNNGVNVNSFELSQNYPNPFNPTTRIDFSLAKASKVTMKIFKVTGEEVITVADGFKNAGKHSVYMNASNLSSGVYLYQLSVDGKQEVKKMVLMK